MDRVLLDEDTAIWYLVKFFSERSYGIIKERDLRVTDQQKGMVMVQEMSKKYQAKIITRGTKKHCEDEANKFELFLELVSEDSCNEEIENQQPTVTETIDRSRQSTNGTTSNQVDFNDPYSGRSQLAATQQYNSTTQLNSPNIEVSSRDNDAIMNELRSLRERVENIDRVGRIPRVMHNDFNLITLSGKNSNRYALKVAAKIFSEVELEKGCILENNRETTRTQLDPVRVEKIKG